jgi:hypothetical protein
MQRLGLACVRQRMHKSRQTGDVIGMEMRQHNAVQRLKPPVEHAHGHLGALATIDQVQPGADAEKRGGEESIRHWLHGAVPEQEYINHVAPSLANPIFCPVQSALVPITGTFVTIIDPEGRLMLQMILVPVDAVGRESR